MAVNPYKMYDMYGLDMVKKYEGQILGTLPPWVHWKYNNDILLEAQGKSIFSHNHFFFQYLLPVSEKTLFTRSKSGQCHKRLEM